MSPCSLIALLLRAVLGGFVPLLALSGQPCGSLHGRLFPHGLFPFRLLALFFALFGFLFVFGGEVTPRPLGIAESVDRRSASGAGGRQSAEAVRRHRQAQSQRRDSLQHPFSVHGHAPL